MLTLSSDGQSSETLLKYSQDKLKVRPIFILYRPLTIAHGAPRKCGKTKNLIRKKYNNNFLIVMLTITTIVTIIVIILLIIIFPNRKPTKKMRLWPARQ